VFVSVITGPPGAGKSTLATAIHDRLADDGRSSALFELDELARCHPPLRRQEALKHASDLARSYEETGHDLLFVTDTCESAGRADA
jgi:DNA replication protein DnaC